MYYRLFLLVLFAATGFAEQPTIRFAVGPWSPYFSDAGQENTVFENEISLFFENELGLAVEYIYVPDWQTAKEMVLHQEAYSTFPFRKTKEREKAFNFSSYSILNDLGVIFCLRDKFPYYKLTIQQDIENIKPFTIGVIKGYISWRQEDLERVSYDNFVEFPDQRSLFKALLNKEIDFASEDLIAGFKAIEELLIELDVDETALEKIAFFPLYHEYGVSSGVNPLYFMTRRSRADDIILGRLNESLRSASQTGQTSHIKNFGFQFIEDKLPYEIVFSGFNSCDALEINESLGTASISQVKIHPPSGTKAIAMEWDNSNQIATVFIINGPYANSIAKIGYERFSITRRLEPHEVFGDEL